MTKKVDMKVVSVKKIAKETYEMVLENDYICQTAVPGQFIHILVDGHMLRRPISIANIDRASKTVSIIFKVIGSGTRALANYEPGDRVDVLGPSGHGFPTNNLSGSTVLLIGGGVGVPPLYYLAKELAGDRSVKIISILGFQSKEYVFYEEKFNQLGETIIMTDDGSHGDKGSVTDAIHQIDSFDRYYTCGPTPMLKAVTSMLENQDGYISLEEYKIGRAHV